MSHAGIPKMEFQLKGQQMCGTCAEQNRTERTKKKTNWNKCNLRFELTAIAYKYFFCQNANKFLILYLMSVSFDLMILQ